MEKENEKLNVTLYMEADVRDALEARAKQEDRSLSWMANKLLRDALQQTVEQETLPLEPPTE